MPTLVKKPPKPRWRAVVNVQGIRREKQFPDGTEESRQAAIKWEERVRRTLLSSKPATGTVLPILTLFNLANAYLDFVKERQSKKTYMEKLAVFKRLLRRFGKDMLIEKVSIADALKFLSDQNRHRSGFAANKERKILITAWTWGEKYLPGFPTGGCPFRIIDRFPEKRSPRYVPPEEDFWMVYNEAEGQDKVLLLTFLFLAARRGEVFNLKWADISFPNNTVTLWTKKRAGGNMEADVVPLIGRLKEVLMAWWEHRPYKSEYVFVNLEELGFCLDYFGRPFKNRQHFMERMCNKAGVRPFGFHGIRHLTASIMYREGQSVAVIQAVLRHKSPQTTTKYLQSLGLQQTHDAMEAVMGHRGPGSVVELSKYRGAVSE